MKPRERRRNAGRSRRQGSRLKKKMRYISRDGAWLPGVSEITGMLAMHELKESLGEVIGVPRYIKPIYLTRAFIGGRAYHTGCESVVRSDVETLTPRAVCMATMALLNTANTRGEMSQEEIRAEGIKQGHAFENFLRWVPSQDFRPFSVERKIVDNELGVGMTADYVGHLGDDLEIVDWKSTADVTAGAVSADLMKKYRVQMGAYWGLTARATGRTIRRARLVFGPKKPNRDVFVVEMKADELQEQWEVFERLLYVYHALNGKE